VFPGEPDARGERGPIDADVLLRHVLRRALHKAGLPPLRFHDLRHMASTLMLEPGVPLRRARDILSHASERTTLAIYTRPMHRTRDDSARQIAELVGPSDLGNKRETIDSVEPEKSELVIVLMAPRVGAGSPSKCRF
jgi:integrase